MISISEFLIHAVEKNASDLFITAGKKPAFRIQGGIVTDPRFPAVSADDINEFRRHVIGESGEEEYLAKGGYDASHTLGGEERYRLNFFTTTNGPGLAVRPIRSGNEVFFGDLNLPQSLGNLCSLQRGLILITGSTGCGKSTTLSAMVHSDKESFVTQREITDTIGGFSQALKFALRENPDVIVIGEMRDMETIQVAIAAAMTGHLVISTVHTTDTIQTIERLLMMFPETQREQLAADLGLSLQAVISQRLLPRADAEGMYPAVEILLGTATVRKQISDRDFNALEISLKAGIHQGMISFNRSLFQLYEQGIITRTTALTASGNANELDLMMKGMENGNDVFLQHYGSDDDDTGMVDMRALFRAAVKNGASDLLLSAGSTPMLRLNGSLRALDLPVLTAEDVERLLFSIISRRQRIVLEEKRELDFALSVSLSLTEGTEPALYRFRLNAFYQRGSLGLVARVVSNEIPTPEQLHLPEVLVNLVGKKQGLI